MHTESPSVSVISYTSSPELTVAIAANTCYSYDVSLENPPTSEDIERIIKSCIKSGHLSILEHANFTFQVEGISRVLTHQLVRHRLASYSQQSQRYVTLNNSEFIVPQSINDNPDAITLYGEMIRSIVSGYFRLIDMGIPPEDARYLLPQGTNTRITITMNARELRHFFQQRCCNRAQLEIRKLAIEMYKSCIRISPLLFIGCGPICRNQPCQEGKFSCKKQDEVIKIFNEIDSGVIQ